MMEKGRETEGKEGGRESISGKNIEYNFTSYQNLPVLETKT